MKNLILSFCMVFITGLAFTQEKNENLKKLIEEQNYIFKAINTTAYKGTSIQLTDDYNLRIAKDSIISYLPYFGRAYTAPINSTEGGIKFLSKDFSYTKTLRRKKNGWNILIKPNDVSEINTLILDISESGYATLNVTSNQKSPISFYGYIIAPLNNK